MVQERTGQSEDEKPAAPPLDMSWKSMTIQWGTRAPIHPQGGLTIGAVNGGGLGLESPGQVNRLLLESRAGWTETSLLLHIFRGIFTRTVYRYLSAYAPTPVELQIGRRAMQDKSRHIAYAMQHLKYAVN